MNIIELRDLFRSDVEADAVRMAIDNGEARSRSIEEYRYQAGYIAGLKHSTYLLDNIINPEEDERE